jgi:hypothetical protein
MSSFGEAACLARRAKCRKPIEVVMTRLVLRSALRAAEG